MIASVIKSMLKRTGRRWVSTWRRQNAAPVLQASARDHHLAGLAALAIALSVAETAFPSPIPGVKPGLANIVTLLALQRDGPAAAAWVVLLRVVVGALLMGSLLSPGFVLSLSAGLASLLVLILAHRLLPARWFGVLSLSLIAAQTHALTQWLVVRCWLIPHPGVIYWLPILCGSAWVFGTINGLLAAQWLPREAQALSATLQKDGAT